jgi:integrase
MIDNRETAKHEPTFLSPDEARAFLKAIKGRRLEALFSVALSLGLREGEVLGLRWEDVQLESASLTVRYQLQRIDGKLQLVEPKTEKSRRTVNMPQVAVASLYAHRARQADERASCGSKWIESGMVFTTSIGTMMDARNLLKAFYSILADNDDVPKLRFHDLRHSAATLLLVQGVHPKVVQELGGWSDIRTVLNTYSDVVESLKNDAADKTDAILNPLASSLTSTPKEKRPNWVS